MKITIGILFLLSAFSVSSAYAGDKAHCKHNSSFGRHKKTAKKATPTKTKKETKGVY